MILRSIEAENFGCFRSAGFEFRRGMNLVTGPNEAGKSTLAELIPATLFGTKQLERFKPWGRSGCAASLVFEGDKRTVEIRRNLLTDEVRVIERDALYQAETRFQGKAPLNGRSAACREYRALLEDLLGIADDDLFRATCMFGQSVAEWTGDALGEKLRQLVSGSDEADFASILDSLLEEHFELTRENPWGRDKQRDRQIELLRAQLAQSTDPPPAQFTMAEAVAPDDLDEQIRTLTDELESDRSEYVRGVCYVEKLRQTLQPPAAAEEPAAAERAVDEQTISAAGDVEALAGPSREALRSRLVEAGLPEDPPEVLPELLEQASRIRQELAEFQRPLAALTKREGQLKNPPWAIAAGLTVVLGCASAGAWFFSRQGLVVSLVSAAGMAAGWGYCLWCSLNARRQRADLQQQKRKLEQSRAVVLERQSELSERCEALGLPSTAVDLVRLQKVVDRNRELLEQWWSRPSDAGPVVSAAPVAPAAETEAAHPAAVNQADDAERAELAELEQRLSDFAAQLKDKELALARLRQQAPAENADDGAPPPEPALQRQLARLEQRLLVVRTAVDLLVQGVEDYRRSHMAGLTEEAGRLLGKMTGGRYPAVRLDEDMRPEIQVDGRRWHPADRFSRGTRDVLYLALRIALARLRGADGNLPLLLDDPFIHLDRTRLSASLRLLDMAAAGGQVLLLSHSEELARRAGRDRWHVISLGESAAGADHEDGDSYAGQLHLL